MAAGRDASRQTRRAAARTWLAGLAAGFCLFLPLYILQGGGNIVGENVQPRYLLPLVMVSLGLALLVPDGRKRWPLGRLRTAILVLTVATANALALHSELRRYLTGHGPASHGDVGSASSSSPPGAQPLSR